MTFYNEGVQQSRTAAQSEPTVICFCINLADFMRLTQLERIVSDVWLPPSNTGGRHRSSKLGGGVTSNGYLIFNMIRSTYSEDVGALLHRAPCRSEHWKLSKSIHNRTEYVFLDCWFSPPTKFHLPVSLGAILYLCFTSDNHQLSRQNILIPLKRCFMSCRGKF